MNERLVAFCLLSALILFGCSDGSDDLSVLEPDSPAAGIYAPSTFAPQGEAVLIGNTEALISPEGDLYLFALDGPWFDEVVPQPIPYLVSGSIEIDGDTIVGPTLHAYPDGQRDIESLSAQGIFVPGDYISMDYTWGATQGDIYLGYSELNSEAPGLEKLEGLWGVVIGFALPGGSSFENLVVTLNVYSDGTAFGSDSTGCTFNGSFSLAGAQYNFYNLSLEISSCGSRDGEYLGLAFIGPCCGDSSDPMLRFSTRNNERSFNARLFGPNFTL